MGKLRDLLSINREFLFSKKQTEKKTMGGDDLGSDEEDYLNPSIDDTTDAPEISNCLLESKPNEKRANETPRPTKKKRRKPSSSSPRDLLLTASRDVSACGKEMQSKFLRSCYAYFMGRPPPTNFLVEERLMEGRRGEGMA